MSRWQAQMGFNLIELSVVLVILGVLAGAGSSTYELMTQARTQATATAKLAEANNALRAYIARNKHLPCPDTRDVAQINIGAPALGACPVTLTKGWLPYQVLGLEVPREGQRLYYGVQRTVLADPVLPDALVPGEFTQLDMAGALIEALKQLANEPPRTTVPYYKHPAPVTADSSATAVIDCGTSGLTINPAYVIIAPGKDLDRIGTTNPEFDNENTRFVTQSGSAFCFAHPNRSSSFRHDDLVVVESPLSLLGWLTRLER